MMKLYNIYISIAEKSASPSLLLIRLILAYGFWEPAKTKWTDINSVAEWFESIGIFAPKLNAYLSASTEMAGVFLLLFGLGTRIIALPLIIVMLVAIKTVHWQYGFPASENGFEIPLYYIIMLMALISFGSGKFSLDFLIKSFKKQST
ncbi:MAG TPA: DoxX family protein [Bacteroidia bacterium]|nr:DoxX family protein [Bacteroidia bacterium]